MKAYAVTEDELENLGLLSIGSTASFSLASFLAAFCLSVWTSIAFSSGTPKEVIAYWQGLSIAAAVATVALIGVGVCLAFRGRSKIKKIKEGTDHG